MVPALYVDDDILILDKPSGLAVQPGAGVRVSVLEAVERDYGFRPWLVHRLDRETSGCLVVARSPRAAASVTALMGGRGAVKTYRAIVLGRPVPEEGVLRDKVRSGGAEKSAETRYRVIESRNGLSLVEAVLGTGRMHQIRQHFAQAGFPIVGDDRHGNFAANKTLAREYGARRLMLYAEHLVLPLDPPVDVHASVPAHFADLWKKLGDPEPYRWVHGAAWLLPDGRTEVVPGFHSEWIESHQDEVPGCSTVADIIKLMGWVSVVAYSRGYVELMIRSRKDAVSVGVCVGHLRANLDRWSNALVMTMDEEGYLKLTPGHFGPEQDPASHIRGAFIVSPGAP